MKITTLFAGLALVILGGIMEGVYSLPLKFSRKWRWENILGAGSMMALLLIPWPLAFETVPNLLEVNRQTSWPAIFWALLFGAGWGVGGIFLGISVDIVGMSLGFSIIRGIIAINGSLTPLLMNDVGQLVTRGSVWFLIAMAVMIAGIAICAIAGKRKENAIQAEHPPQQRQTRVFWIGMLLCVPAGLLSGLVNSALIFGTEITQRSGGSGTGPLVPINALWCLVFTSNYLVNVGYCAYLLWRNRSFRNYLEKGTGSYWLQSTPMVWRGPAA